MILDCKFHILGIKTTLGQHIAKNLPVYDVIADVGNGCGECIVPIGSETYA